MSVFINYDADLRLRVIFLDESKAPCVKATKHALCQFAQKWRRLFTKLLRRFLATMVIVRLSVTIDSQINRTPTQTRLLTAQDVFGTPP